MTGLVPPPAAGDPVHSTPRPETPASADPDLPPWDSHPPAEPAPGERHDAFGEVRKCDFLRALAKTGCILDACRSVGVSAQTVYRHRDDDPRFAGHMRLALDMAATPIELLAWSRAVEGVEQEFACGGEVHVRRRFSDGLLRLLLQGSNPKKYGPNPGFKRKHLLKAEKKRIEREVRAEIEASEEKWSFEEAFAALDKELAVFRRKGDRAKNAAGWTRTPGGHWIPPGYGPLPGYESAPEPPGAAGEPPCETVSSSSLSSLS